jgi:pyridoxal phosphate enzyme (YggS family)
VANDQTLYSRYELVLSSIQEQLISLGRAKDSVTLLAVSKTHPASAMQELIGAATAHGKAVVFGENYVQEFKHKHSELPSGVDCHLIGHLQRNKARDAVRLFSVIESVDSAELLAALQKEASREGKLQQIFLQVNVSQDPAKRGCMPNDLPSLIEQELPRASNIRLCGLMTITALYDNPEDARPDFRTLRTLRDEILASQSLCQIIGESSLGLSMGMSSDYGIAIEEGATVVRVGSAIFGSRQ